KSAGVGGLAGRLDDLWRQIRIVGASDGLLAALLLLGLAFGARRRPQPLTFQRLLPWVWLIAVPALYVARGVPVLSRYLLPLLPVLAWLAWRALESWALGEPAAIDAQRATRVGAIAGAIAALVLAQNLVLYRTAVVPQVRSFSAAMRHSVIPWARRLGALSAPRAVIATPDIGAFGYFSERRILDLGGLVTPAMVPLLEREEPEDVVSKLEFERFS